MKRIIALLVCLCCLAACFAGCGFDNGRIAYNMELSDLEDCIKAPNYKGIKVDKSSAEFSKLYGEIIELDISENDFYLKKAEGTVEKGDDIFVDYSAKIDGVVLDVAKAVNELRENVGSNPLFVDGCKVEGFDEGLVGAPIGTEFSLNLTFPSSYPDQAISGKAVIFTVLVRYVDEDVELKPEEYYEKMGYRKYEDYVKNVENRAIKQYLINYVVENSKIKEYPEDEVERIYKEFGSAYNNDDEVLNKMLEQAGESKEQYENSVMEYYVHPRIDQQLPIYYIFDKEEFSYSEKELQDLTEEIVEKYKKFDISKSDLLSDRGENYFEYLIVREKVENFLYKNANIID